MYGIGEDKFRSLLEVDQLAIWGLILGKPVEIGELFTSPFRLDTKPGCYLRLHKGLVLFTDWAFPEYLKYTCIHALSHLNRIPMVDAARLVIEYDTRGLKPQVGMHQAVYISGRKVQSDGKKVLTYQPFEKDGKLLHTTADEEYWGKRNIEYPQLMSGHQPCLSVYRYTVNGTIIYPRSYPCYALTFSSGNWKIYCPNNTKETRFPFSTGTKNDYWYWKTGTRSAIITKSYKDGEEIHRITKLDTYVFLNEGTIPENLDFLEGYESILVLYDNDQAGMYHGNKLANLLSNAKAIFYPPELGKDTDDLVISGNSNYVYQFILSHDRHSKTETSTSKLDGMPSIPASAKNNGQLGPREVSSQPSNEYLQSIRDAQG